MRRLDSARVGGVQIFENFLSPGAQRPMQFSSKRPQAEANPRGTRVAKNHPPVISFLVMELCAQVCSRPYLQEKLVKMEHAFEIANLPRSLPQAPRVENLNRT